MEPPANPVIEEVQLDGLVLLKIIKHCQENFPDQVTGQLLGLDSEKRLEITSCFPGIVYEDSTENENYSVDMLKALRDVNTDNNVVGWYQSAFMGSFLSLSVLKLQYEYQAKIPSSVVVVYDPFRTTLGRLALKAYRLTARFMRLYQGKTLSVEAFKREMCDSRTVYEELPIKVHNSHLVHGFLYELREQKSMNCASDRLVIEPARSLKTKLQNLSNAIDEYSQEQSRYMFELKKQQKSKQALKAKRLEANEKRQRMGMDPLPEEDYSMDMPSRLETFLNGKTIDLHAKHILETSSLALYRAYAIDALQGDPSSKEGKM